MTTENKMDVRRIYALAWPIAMNAILLQLILIIDTLLVGPLGEEALAAMGLAASIAGIILGLIFAYSNGSQLLIAQAVGAEDRVQTQLRFRTGVLINLLIATLGSLFILLAGAPLITAIATTPSMAALAIDYLNVFTVVSFGVAGSQGITVFFNAIGNSRIPFYVNVIEAPVNVLCSLVLIYGLYGFPALGLAGAAVGSAVAVFCRLLFLLAFRRHYQRTQAPIAEAKITYQVFAHHLRHATPVAATFISMVLASSLCMMIYARLSINQFAALTLIMPWVRIVGQISTAWAQAMGILVGQILGSKQWERLNNLVQRGWKVALFISVGMSLIYFLMFYLFELFYPDLQQETLDTLWQFMPILVVLPLIRASNTLCGHVLRAGGDAMHVFKIHSYTQWLVTVPLSALFVLYFELPAVWVFALILVEELVKAVPFHWRMYQGKWKRALV